jgi:hypothetical protein
MRHHFDPTSDPELGGPAQSFPPVFFFWREAKFFEALGRTKKQTYREQHKARQLDNRPPRCLPF